MTGDFDSTQDWEGRLEHLLLDRFDVPAIDDARSDEPRCLRVLRRAAEATKVFGFQNELLPRPSGPSEVIDVIAENQGVWTIGYLADGTDQPDAVVYGYNVDEFYALVDRGLPRLLYQSAFIEAVFSHPNVSIGSHVDTAAAADVLALISSPPR